jgi:hypothetical protein
VSRVQTLQWFLASLAVQFVDFAFAHERHGADGHAFEGYRARFRLAAFFVPAFGGEAF